MQCQKRAGGGFKQVIANYVDASAFLPTPVFYCFWERALKKLEAAGQGSLVEYLTQRAGVGSLVRQNDVWCAKWQSSIEHVDPGFSTYSPNVIESYWRREDTMHGKNADHEVASAVFRKIENTVRVWATDSHFSNFLHAPGGLHAVQRSLVRGRGLWQGRGAFSARAFRRLTVEKLAALQKGGQQVCWAGGCVGPFTQAWVLVHHDAAAFSEHRMRELLIVMMAPHVSACEDAFPGIASSLSNFLSLLHDFTIVGRTAAGRILDLHRNFIIKNTSEHALYIDFLGVGSLVASEALVC